MPKSLALFAILAVMLYSLCPVAAQAGGVPAAIYASSSNEESAALTSLLLPELITPAAAAQEEVPAEEQVQNNEQAQNKPPQQKSKAEAILSTIGLIFLIFVGIVLGTMGSYAYRRYRILRSEGRYQSKTLGTRKKEVKPVKIVRKPKLIPVQSKPVVPVPDDINPLRSQEQLVTEDQASFVVDEIDSVVEEAKFFMALGRASRAVDLLVDHIEANVDSSAQPWVYLMEVYRSLGEKEAFVELATHFRARFNVVEPQWEYDDAELMRPVSLDEFPRIESKLITMWGTADCVRFLIELISNNRDGTRVGFSMEIFDELLLLLAIAEMRDDMPG